MCVCVFCPIFFCIVFCEVIFRTISCIWKLISTDIHDDNALVCYKKITTDLTIITCLNVFDWTTSHEYRSLTLWRTLYQLPGGTSL